MPCSSVSRALRAEDNRSSLCYQRCDDLLSSEEVHPDQSEVGKTFRGGLRHGIGHEHRTKIAFAGVEQRGPRAVGKVAAGDHHRVDLVRVQPSLESGSIERAPPRLVYDRLAGRKLLWLTP